MGNLGGNRSSVGRVREILKLIWTINLFLLLVILAGCGLDNPLARPTSTLTPPMPTLAPTATSPPIPGSVAGFHQFLIEVSDLKKDQRQEKVNRYMAQLNLVPLTEGETALFLFQGAADSVNLIGDMNAWNPESSLPLSRLEGSDLWYLLTDFEPEARLDYRFEINGISRQLDPLNPNTLMSETGPNSVLMMPGYLTPAELNATDTTPAAGKLTSHSIESRFLEQTRSFIVYEPAGQIVGQKLPSLFLNDGGNYLNLIDTPALLDALIAQRQIPPMVVVFLPPVLALEEYSQNNAYISFLADELVPFVRENFGTDNDPAATGIMGSGVGGLAALYAAQTRSDVFGLAAGQSVANLGVDDGLIELSSGSQSGRTLTDLPDRIYLVVGSYETAISVQGVQQDLLADNRLLAKELAASGQEVRYEELPEGHSWGLWQGSFGRALSYLYNK